MRSATKKRLLSMIDDDEDLVLLFTSKQGLAAGELGDLMYVYKGSDDE